MRKKIKTRCAFRRQQTAIPVVGQGCLRPGLYDLHGRPAPSSRSWSRPTVNPARRNSTLRRWGSVGFRCSWLPAPLFFAWIVALLESAGAVLLILGILTRPIALGLAVDMLVAIVSVRIRMAKAPFASTQQVTAGSSSSRFSGRPWPWCSRERAATGSIDF